MSEPLSPEREHVIRFSASCLRDAVEMHQVELSHAFGLEDTETLLAEIDWLRAEVDRLREITDKDAATIERLTTHAGMADGVQLQLAHQAETLQAKDAATTEAVERWARAFDEKAETLAVWQQERLSGITSATPKYEAMNASHEAFQWASYELRAAVRLPEKGEPA